MLVEGTVWTEYAVLFEVLLLMTTYEDTLSFMYYEVQTADCLGARHANTMKIRYRYTKSFLQKPLILLPL